MFRHNKITEFIVGVILILVTIGIVKLELSLITILFSEIRFGDILNGFGALMLILLLLGIMIVFGVIGLYLILNTFGIDLFDD